MMWLHQMTLFWSVHRLVVERYINEVVGEFREQCILTRSEEDRLHACSKGFKRFPDQNRR